MDFALVDLLQGSAKAGENQFVGIVVGIGGGYDEIPADEELVEVVNRNSSNFAGDIEGNTFLAEKSDRNFSHPIGFVEGVSSGEGIGKIDRNLHSGRVC